MDYSERSRSIWKHDMQPLRTAPLSSDCEVEVCIVGAGMVGMSVAYELACVGKRVVVLDDNAIGGGETAQTTAHLASALDDRFWKLERMHGEQGAKLAYDSHAAAIDRIERIVREEGIDCGFSRLEGYLLLALGQLPDELDRELASVERIGIKGVQMLARAPHLQFETGPCLEFPRQAQFHPLRYLAGLLRAIERRGGRVFTGTHVDEVCDRRLGKLPYVRTSDGCEVRAQAIVVATNTPVNDRIAIHTKQAAMRTYVIGFDVPRSSAAPALYWDTEDPYHYVRWLERPDDSDHALLLVGGEDHPTGRTSDAAERFTRLYDWARPRFHCAAGPRYRWSGQVLEPVDGLAFIGQNPGSDAVYIATGDSGNGMTHGAIAGLLLRDLIVGAPNPWTALYDPSRKHFSLVELAKTGFQATASYALWLRASPVDALAEIPRGEGRVVQHGVKKLAVYRDDDGKYVACSAACPHLGGVVGWNELERSWDCPLHGSRFDVDGSVLNGPACRGLEHVDLPQAGLPPHELTG